MTVNITATEELSRLGDKRDALEQAVKIAVTVERLHHGLKAAMLMGKPTASIPKHMMEKINNLDETVRMMPSVKIKEILGRLEKTVQNKLSLIISLADMNEEQLIAAEANQDQDIEGVLREYRKKSQTAVTLKILLYSRGEVTKPLALSVSSDDVREKLVQLDKKEQVCRKTVRKEIVILIADTNRILARPDLPKEMREVVAATQQDFELNLTHIDAGKTVITLPIAFEIIEMGEGKDTKVEDALPESQQIEVPSQKETQTTPINTPSPPKEKPPLPAGKRPGFFYKFFRWISTPFDVSWKDIESEINTRYDNKK